MNRMKQRVRRDRGIVEDTLAATMKIVETLDDYSDAEIKTAVENVRLCLSLVAKLGHRLASPTATEIATMLHENLCVMMQRRGPDAVRAVSVPEFGTRAVTFLRSAWGEDVLCTYGTNWSEAVV